MMQMSGTSVATPLVSGTAALMLQINPRMTPNMVKAFIEYTAQKLAGSEVLEQGAGELNVEGAMKLTTLVRPDLASPINIGLSLLTATPPNSSSFAGNTFTWNGTIIRKFNTMSGTSLVTRMQGPYCTGEVLGDGFLISDGLILNEGKMYSGLLPAAN